MVQTYSGNEHIYHLADLVHSAVLTIEHPEWGFDGDTDFNLAVKTRINVLADLAEYASLTFSAHLPWPGFGHIGEKIGCFEWLQKTLPLPD